MLWRPSKLLGHHEKFDPDRVVVCGYANAYSGYVTTPEEYQVQEYVRIAA